MKLRSIIAAVYAVFLTYSFSSLFFGQSGAAALEKISYRNKLLSANLADLEEQHQKLESHLSTLMTDPESVAVGVRRLGLVADGEYLVVMNPSKKIWEETNAGKVLQLDDLKRQDSGFLWIFCLTVGVIVFLVSLAVGRGQNAGYQKR